jgi:hypothetical protein
MKIIFYDKEGKEVKDQDNFCLTHEGEIACWDESQGWSTSYSEGMSFIIDNPRKMMNGNYFECKCPLPDKPGCAHRVPIDCVPLKEGETIEEWKKRTHYDE